MKNKILYLLSVLVTLGFWSCDIDTTDGLTDITYYPVITLLGDNPAIVYIGENYEDAGVSVILNGEDVTDETEIASNVDASTLGYYTVTYTASNDDGFSNSAERTVYVIDASSIATMYFGESEFGSYHYYDAPVKITDNGDGTYEIDDLAGGFYWYGRYNGYEAYGYDFHAESTIKFESDNTITMVEGGSWYWSASAGYDFLTITSGTYDPTTKTITLVLDFDGDAMYVTLEAVS